MDPANVCALALEIGGDDLADVYAEQTHRTEITATDAETTATTVRISSGLGIRVSGAHGLGFAFASSPSRAQIAGSVQAARDAAALATSALPRPAHLVSAPRPIVALDRPAVRKQQTEKRRELARTMYRIAADRSHGIIVRRCIVGDESTHIAVAAKHSAHVVHEFRRTSSWCAVSVLASDSGGTAQSGEAFRFGREHAELDVNDCAHEAQAKACALVGAQTPPAGDQPVVLSPPAAAALAALIGDALSGSALASGRSPFTRRSGSRVAPECVSLSDDGRWPSGMKTAPFDGEGVPTQRTALINEGVVVGALHSLETAATSAAESTGNALRSSYRTPPTAAPSNIFLEPHQSTLAEMLNAADGGIYIQRLFARRLAATGGGRFGFGAAGWRIARGELGQPLTGITIGGEILDVLSQIERVGRDFQFSGSRGAPTIGVASAAIGGR